MELKVDLLDHIGDLLQSGDVESLKQLMAEETRTFRHLLEEKANDLIPMASYYLNKETMETNPRLFRYAVKLINSCAENGNPKECLMEYLAQVENLDEIKFQYLLQPIQTSTLRISDRKGPLMQCVFNIVYSFINSLPLPKDYKLEKESKSLLESDDIVRKIREHYRLILKFYEPFVLEVCDKQYNTNNKGMSIRSVLLQALFRLLGQPLVYLDLESNEKGPTSMGTLASKIVGFIQKVQNDPVRWLVLVENCELITIKEEKKQVEEFSCNEIYYSSLSVSLFFYMVFCENSIKSIPYVYSKHFIFQNCLVLATILLNYKESLVLRKGLLLAKSSLTQVEDSGVPFSFLASKVHKEIIELLSNIMVYHDVEENRKLAAEVMKLHISKFEPKAQFYIFIQSDLSNKHPNILGYCTTIITSLVRETFTNTEMKLYFTGKRLYDLLSILCSLKKGGETDLLENKDPILSALNLIIFLTRRDRDNYTGIWDYIPYLQKHFLKPLREAINLSRAHFKQELKSLDDSEKKTEDGELAVTVGEEELKKMSVDEKKSVINSGLTVFDLIDHVLCRANECIEDKPKSII